MKQNRVTQSNTASHVFFILRCRDDDEDDEDEDEDEERTQSFSIHHLIHRFV